MVKVSICCITYNHENYIADAIDSFLMQSVNFPIEIIIHDDASTDKTPQIIECYKQKFPDLIKTIYQVENQYSKGVRISVRNVFPKASGTYIALCEGDDYWTDSKKLQKQVEFLDSHQNYSMCFHAAKVVTPEKKSIIKFVKPFNGNQDVTLLDFIKGGGGFFPTASLVFRKELVNDVPDFLIKSSIGDWPLVLLLSYKGKAYYIDEFMSSYRYQCPGSWSYINLTNGNLEGKINILKNDIYLLEKFNEYTNGIYDRTISKCILKRKYKICVFQQESFDIYKNPSNYKIFRKIDIVSKIQFFLLHLIPQFFIKLLIDLNNSFFKKLYKTNKCKILFLKELSGLKKYFKGNKL